MKKILLSFIALAVMTFLPFSAAMAQKHTTYTVKCGKSTSSLEFIAGKAGSETHLEIIIGTQHAEHVMDSNLETVSWHVYDKAVDTDYIVTREGGFYLIKGKFKGKVHDDKVKDEGYPWYQHIGYVEGRILKPGEKRTFVCVRPTDLKVFAMTAEITGTEAIGDYKDATCVKVCPAGALAKFWKSRYYFDPQTLEFVGYRAVEGGPGTPESFWFLDK